MKKLFIGVFSATLLASCTQDKIGFVDNAKLMNEYQEKIDMENKYKKKFEKFDKKTDSISKLFQIEAEAFDANKNKMSPGAAQAKYQELLQKKQLIGQQLQGEEQVIVQESQKEIDSLKSKVRKFVKDYGKNNGYTFILGSTENGSILYGSEAKDVTEEVVKALNKAYGKKE